MNIPYMDGMGTDPWIFVLRWFSWCRWFLFPSVRTLKRSDVPGNNRWRHGGKGFQGVFCMFFVGWNTTELDAEKKMNPSKFIQWIVWLFCCWKCNMMHPNHWINQKSMVLTNYVVAFKAGKSMLCPAMIWSEMGVLVQATRQRARTLTWTETW